MMLYLLRDFLLRNFHLFANLNVVGTHAITRELFYFRENRKTRWFLVAVFTREEYFGMGHTMRVFNAA